MNDYTPYRDTIRVHDWTHVPVQDKWQDARHVFGGRCFLRYDIKEWFKNTIGGSYAVLDDEEHFCNHVIAFSQPKDASMFLLRWS